jgi:hypothetical protein
LIALSPKRFWIDCNHSASRGDWRLCLVLSNLSL